MHVSLHWSDNKQLSDIEHYFSFASSYCAVKKDLAIANPFLDPSLNEGSLACVGTV